MLKDFIQTISHYSDLLKIEGANSWHNTNFAQSEPNIIHDYLSQANQGVNYLNQNIASVITNETDYVMKFASIFCHQKPRIRRTEDNILQCKGSTRSESCELGDLMIQFILLDENKEIQFSNALIIQAKKGVKADNATQQCLYENDDRLIFPNYFGNANEECLLPSYEDNRTDALAYLFLENNRANISQIPLAFNLQFPFDFLLSRILTNDIGKPFTYSEDGYQNDWDKLISKTIYNLAGCKYRQEDRINGLYFLLNRFNYYYYYPEYYYESEYEGIPIMQIIVRHKKEGENVKSIFKNS